jgi:hypothetical protein
MPELDLIGLARKTQHTTGFMRYCRTHGYFWDVTSDIESNQYDPCPLGDHTNAHTTMIAQRLTADETVEYLRTKGRYTESDAYRTVDGMRTSDLLDTLALRDGSATIKYDAGTHFYFLTEHIRCGSCGTTEQNLPVKVTDWRTDLLCLACYGRYEWRESEWTRSYSDGQTTLVLTRKTRAVTTGEHGGQW